MFQIIFQIKTTVQGKFSFLSVVWYKVREMKTCRLRPNWDDGGVEFLRTQWLHNDSQDSISVQQQSAEVTFFSHLCSALSTPGLHYHVRLPEDATEANSEGEAEFPLRILWWEDNRSLPEIGDCWWEAMGAILHADWTLCGKRSSRVSGNLRQVDDGMWC